MSGGLRPHRSNGPVFNRSEWRCAGAPAVSSDQTMRRIPSAPCRNGDGGPGPLCLPNIYLRTLDRSSPPRRVASSFLNPGQDISAEFWTEYDENRANAGRRPGDLYATEHDNGATGPVFTKLGTGRRRCPGGKGRDDQGAGPGRSCDWDGRASARAGQLRQNFKAGAAQAALERGRLCLL
jgi:hypothetical protein